MRRPCSQCGGWFVPGRPNQRQCWPCWHQREDRHESREVVIEQQLLDERTLRAAIRLTHPDAQPVERRELATTITAKLLDALETVRASKRIAA